jgi:hypothetical protein
MTVAHTGCQLNPIFIAAGVETGSVSDRAGFFRGEKLPQRLFRFEKL